MAQCLADPRWSHIRFVRLTSAREVEAFAAAVETRRGSRRWQITCGHSDTVLVILDQTLTEYADR